MKQLKISSMLCLLMLTIACTNKGIDFRYSPAEPRAGQSVVFTNLSEKGDKWAWDYGDGSTSTTKSPSHTFLRPGTYTVTLMVDSARYKTVSKQITIYDTVPSLTISTDSILYMQSVTFEALVYNPFSKAVTYKWHLPEDAVVVSGTTESRSVSVYFNRHDVSTDISLDVELNGKQTTIDTTVFVYDNPATAIVLATGTTEQMTTVTRQRIFDIGIPTPDTLFAWMYVNMPSNGYVSHISTIGIHTYLYITNSHLSLLDIALDAKDNITTVFNGKSETISGTEVANNLYWTQETNAIYLTALPIASTDINAAKTAATTVCTIDGLTTIDKLQISGNQMFFVSDNSIYRAIMPTAFGASVSATKIYTATSAITDLALDALNQKLYVVADKMLTVLNTNGTQATEYTEMEANAICLAADLQCFIIANSEGVFTLPLVYNPQNRITAEPILISSATDATAIGYDEAQR